MEISQSPVIEFLYPQMEPDVLRPGRLYFVKDYLDKIEMKEKMKAESFISAAEDLFKWFRKTFKNNTKLNDYEGYYISERAFEWKEQTGKKLLLE